MYTTIYSPDDGEEMEKNVAGSTPLGEKGRGMGAFARRLREDSLSSQAGMPNLDLLPAFLSVKHLPCHWPTSSSSYAASLENGRH